MVRKLMRRWLGIDEVSHAVKRLRERTENHNVAVQDNNRRLRALMEVVGVQEKFEPVGVLQERHEWVMSKRPKSKT